MTGDNELYRKAFDIQQQCCMEYDEEMIDHIYEELKENEQIESRGRQMDEERKHSHNPLWVWLRFHKPSR